MRFNLWPVVFGFAVFICIRIPLRAEIPFRWPTPNSAFARGENPETYVQPTESGKTRSALFGCVRNEGERFHEGLDLAPLKRNRRGDPSDPILAALDGRVVYINRNPGHSNYGIYVVLDHPDIQPAIYSLYAHLNSINAKLKIGFNVAGGDKLGVMGNSASGYSIPPDRTHLHFEMGLRLSDNFDEWYEQNGFPDKNVHGNYNGMNLMGFDPHDFYMKDKSGEINSIENYIKTLPVAYTLRISSAKTPHFISHYPELLRRPLSSATLTGWDIQFTSWGLPISWIPRYDNPHPRENKGEMDLVSFNAERLKEYSCRETVVLTGEGPEIGNGARRTIEIIFGSRWDK